MLTLEEIRTARHLPDDSANPDGWLAITEGRRGGRHRSHRPYRAALIRACRALDEHLPVHGGHGYCPSCDTTPPGDHRPDCDAEWARQVLDVLEVEE